MTFTPKGAVNTSRKQQLQAALEECAATLDYTGKMPPLVFDLRGRTAGQANYTDWIIRINRDLMHGTDEQWHHILHVTLPHEFAHIYAYHTYGRIARGHGEHWQDTMWRLGLSPNRCHTLETTPARKTTKYLYRCRCGQELWRSSIKHKRTQQGQQYVHKVCGYTIRPQDFVNPLDW